MIERTVVGDIDRADGLALLSIFGGLAYPRLDVNQIIGSHHMRESRLFREAREEGQQQGRILSTRDLTIDTLRIRFGAEAINDLPTIINTIEDLTFLRTVYHLAVSCAALDEFRSHLSSHQNPTTRAPQPITSPSAKGNR